MRKSIVVYLLAASAALSSHAYASIIPPIGLAPGSEYQLIFVSAGATDVTATNTNISSYNSFVTAQAALDPSLPSATWTIVGSTGTVEAYANAPNLIVDGSYLPVYNTQGIEVQGPDFVAGLYSGGDLQSPVQYDQFGRSALGTVFTGIGGGPLGAIDVVEYGDAYSLREWASAGVEPVEYGVTTGSVYALSSAITVPTPEPATITLLGSALLLIGGVQFARRRTAGLEPVGIAVVPTPEPSKLLVFGIGAAALLTCGIRKWTHLVSGRRMRKPLAVFLLVVVAAISPSATSADPVTIAWSAVGNPDNAADSNGYGAVDYSYNIGTYDVSVSQYVAFLNSNDPDRRKHARAVQRQYE